MKILIIGGSRFTGWQLVKKLENHNLTIFNRGTIPRDYGKHTYIKGDRNNGILIKDKFDVVIDTCAYNGQQTKEVLKLDFDHYIQIGTAASYKKTEIFPLTEDSPLGEWQYWGEYNARKIECEDILEESGISYSSVRPVYIIGAGNHLNRERYIYSKLLKHEPIILPGEAIIQFIFVQDLAKIIAHLAENKIKGIFNCCGDEFITLKGLVEEMAKIAGVKPTIEYGKSDFPFANENFICSNHRIKELGIEFTPLIEGLTQDYNNFYRQLYE